VVSPLDGAVPELPRSGFVHVGEHQEKIKRKKLILFRQNSSIAAQADF
jgi:hypothetical protein